MAYKSVRDLDLKGKRVFIRVDFNVPLEKDAQGHMQVTSDKRINARSAFRETQPLCAAGISNGRYTTN